MNGSTVDVSAAVESSRGSFSQKGERPSSTAPSGPPVTVVRTPACSRNTPDMPVGDNSCRAAGANCPPGELLTTVWARTGEGPWTSRGTRCTGEAAAAGAPVQVPAVTLADLQRVGLPAGAVEVQPGDGQALVNVPVIVHTRAETVVRDTTVLGFPVTVRATPVSWTWSFGDGGTLGPTSLPGAPYPAHDLTHTYVRGGDHEIVLTTAYRGEYTIAGLPYQPVEGLATVVSEPVPIHLLEGTDVLTR